MSVFLTESAMKERGGEEGTKVRFPRNRTPVRRCLFGTPDHESTRRDLVFHMEQMDAANQRKWNFNFKDCCPLQGQYEWTRESGTFDLDPEMDRSPEVLSESETLPGSSVYRSASCSELPVLDCHEDSGLDGEEVPRWNWNQYSPTPGSVFRHQTTTIPAATVSSSSSSTTSYLPKTKRQTTVKKYFRVKKRTADKLKRFK